MMALSCFLRCYHHHQHKYTTTILAVSRCPVSCHMTTTTTTTTTTTINNTNAPLSIPLIYYYNISCMSQTPNNASIRARRRSSSGDRIARHSRRNLAQVTEPDTSRCDRHQAHVYARWCTSSVHDFPMTISR